MSKASLNKMSGSVPYIGSRMSLISKAEIRYEGFLHEIDTNNTTVTLKNVRSFGTENRRTDKVIPPKDDVFQYIIFRGTDIKDISVCEAAAFTDPAIVQSGPPAPNSTTRGQPPQAGQPIGQAPVGSTITPDAVSPTPATFPPFAMPAPAQAKHHPPSVPSPQLFRDAPAVQESQISPEPLVDQSRQLNTITEQSTNRANNQMRQQQNVTRQNSGLRSDNTGFRNDSNRNNENRSYSATARQGGQYPRNNYQDYNRSYTYNPNAVPYSHSYGAGGNNYSRSNQMAATPLMGNNHQMQNRGFNNYQNNYRWNQNNAGVRRMGQRHPNHNENHQPGTGDLKIDEEFDIDDANRKFDKSQLEKEFAHMNVQGQGEVENEQVQTLADLEEGELNDDSRSTEACKFYDKTKSFFDSISCDALEKKTSRLTTAEEKKLNYQTFGTPAVSRNRHSGPHNYNNGPGFRPRSAGNFGAPHDNYRRGGNYYGGFNNSNYRRGAGGGSNSYYTSNYSGGGNRQQNYRQRQNVTGGNNPSVGATVSNRVSQPTQA